MENTLTDSVYVMADNGLLYRNPVICGDSIARAFWSLTFGDSIARVSWSLTFDYGAEPAVSFDVVTLPFPSRLRYFQDFISQQGIVARLADARWHGERVPYWDVDEECVVWRLTDCVVYPAVVMEPIPHWLIRGEEGVYQPRGQCRIYSFGRSWG